MEVNVIAFVGTTLVGTRVLRQRKEYDGPASDTNATVARLVHDGTPDVRSQVRRNPRDPFGFAAGFATQTLKHFGRCVMFMFYVLLNLFGVGTHTSVSSVFIPSNDF